jgi:hypothetical protein
MGVGYGWLATGVVGGKEDTIGVGVGTFLPEIPVGATVGSNARVAVIMGVACELSVGIVYGINAFPGCSVKAQKPTTLPRHMTNARRTRRIDSFFRPLRSVTLASGSVDNSATSGKGVTGRFLLTSTVGVSLTIL